MGENNIQDFFNKLAFDCLLTAVNRQYLKYDELLKENGFCPQNLINPTIKDIVQKMTRAGLQTKLVQLFEEAVKTTPTFESTPDKVNHRVAAAITQQIKAAQKRKPSNRPTKYTK